jgi:hypothetical protein
MITREVLICGTCKGYGYISEEKRVCYEDYETVKTVCEKCLGSGKVVKTTTIIIHPFDENLHGLGGKTEKEKIEKLCYDCRTMRGDRDDSKCLECKNNIYHKPFYFEDSKITICNKNYIGD